MSNPAPKTIDYTKRGPIDYTKRPRVGTDGIVRLKRGESISLGTAQTTKR